MAKLRVYTSDELRNMKSGECSKIDGDIAYVTFGQGAEQFAYKLSDIIDVIASASTDDVSETKTKKNSKK